MLIMQSILGILSVLCVRVVSGADWCYQSQVSCNGTCIGPVQWGEVSGNCNARAQSPVNIVTRNVLPDGQLSPFQLSSYQDAFTGPLINNGHTVQLDLPDKIKLKGGNLPATYKALQLHLHWGKDGGPGSEHTIDGEQYPMEMHIVHIKESYPNISEAIKDRTGVAVLGFLFQESSSENAKFKPLITALENITQPTNSTTLVDVTLEMFSAPQEAMTRYFRYHGSLTTPGCAEAVVWSLFEYAIPLSREQLAAFSGLQFASGQAMVETYRPVQPLNGRQVYYSGGQVAVLSCVLLISSMLCSAFSLQTA